MEIESIENGVKITISKKENYTISDLRQELINYLTNKLIANRCLNNIDVEILKILAY